MSDDRTSTPGVADAEIDRRISDEGLDADGLWSRYGDELLVYARRQLADDQVAEDLVQSALFKAHRSLAGGFTPRNPRAWLYKIAHNLALDVRRSASRRAAALSQLATDPGCEPSLPREGAEHADLMARALPLFIARLDSPYREAIQWTDIDGLSHADAAARAGISVSGMKSRVQRARAQLGRELKRSCEISFDALGRVAHCAPRASYDGPMPDEFDGVKLEATGAED